MTVVAMPVSTYEHYFKATLVNIVLSLSVSGTYYE